MADPHATNTSESAAVTSKVPREVRRQPCRIVRGIFGRFFLAHPDQDDFGWSGSAWVPCTDRGIPTGITQVSNFATEADALTYCANCGLVPVGPGPMGPPADEIQNPEIQALLRKIAEQLGAKMPNGWGFTLLIFEYGGPGKSLFYISSAQRPDMMSTMREFITKFEGHDA